MIQDKLCDKLWGIIGLAENIIFCQTTHVLLGEKELRFFYTTAKISRLDDIYYNYEMDYLFIISSTFAYSLQKLFKVSILNLIAFMKSS